MWQRLQTLYLLIATVLVALLFFSEKVDGVTYVSYVPYLILIIVITLLNVLALTTYKFRVFQMRTAVLSALITLGLQIWLVVDFITAGKTAVFHISAIFPIASAILDALAARSIMSDELLVRRVDRLRSSRKKKKPTK